MNAKFSEMLLQEKHLCVAEKFRVKHDVCALLHQAPVPTSAVESPVFDVDKNIRLVPPFLEREVEKYFQNFKSFAESLKWPKDFWT